MLPAVGGVTGWAALRWVGGSWFSEGRLRQVSPSPCAWRPGARTSARGDGDRHLRRVTRTRGAHGGRWCAPDHGGPVSRLRDAARVDGQGRGGGRGAWRRTTTSSRSPSWALPRVRAAADRRSSRPGRRSRCEGERWSPAGGRDPALLGGAAGLCRSCCATCRSSMSPAVTSSRRTCWTSRPGWSSAYNGEPCTSTLRGVGSGRSREERVPRRGSRGRRGGGGDLAEPMTLRDTHDQGPGRLAWPGVQPAAVDGRATGLVDGHQHGRGPPRACRRTTVSGCWRTAGRQPDGTPRSRGRGPHASIPGVVGTTGGDRRICRFQKVRTTSAEASARRGRQGQGRKRRANQ